MHLEINQSNSYANTEVVSNKLIKKLYDLAYEDDLNESVLDSTSVLKGRLKVTATYKECIDYLTEKYPDLIITADTYYYRFVDPEMEKLVVKYYGGGEDGVTTQMLATITNLSNLFYNELSTTSILILDFAPFINITNIYSNFIKNVPNLKEIRVKDYKGRFSFSFDGCGEQKDPYSTTKVVDKVILDGIQLGYNLDENTMTLVFNAINGDIPSAGQIVDIFAVKRIAPNCYYSERPLNATDTNKGFSIGTYFLRGKRINNFYLGEPNPERVKFIAGYGDGAGGIVNFYVPIGCAEAYLNSTSWGTRWSNFIEYDFDLDPDNIFK